MNMRQTQDIYFGNGNEERHFIVKALSARDGFKLMQEGTLLLVKAGALSSLASADFNKAAANFSLESLQNANISTDDLLEFEGALLRSVTFMSAKGTMTQLSWDNIDSFCNDQLEIFKLLAAAFKVNFGFLKDALQSISQPSQGGLEGKTKEPQKTTSKRPTFQMR